VNGGTYGVQRTADARAPVLRRARPFTKQGARPDQRDQCIADDFDVGVSLVHIVPLWLRKSKTRRRRRKHRSAAAAARGKRQYDAAPPGLVVAAGRQRSPPFRAGAGGGENPIEE